METPSYVDILTNQKEILQRYQHQQQEMINEYNSKILAWQEEAQSRVNKFLQVTVPKPPGPEQYADLVTALLQDEGFKVLLLEVIRQVLSEQTQTEQPAGEPEGTDSE